MFAAIGLAAFLAMTPAEASSAQDVAQIINQQEHVVSDFDAGTQVCKGVIWSRPRAGSGLPRNPLSC